MGLLSESTVSVFDKSVVCRFGKHGVSPYVAAAAFNVPVVLTHLLSSSRNRFSRLERLIFSESFVREEIKRDLICELSTDKGGNNGDGGGEDGAALPRTLAHRHQVCLRYRTSKKQFFNKRPY